MVKATVTLNHGSLNWPLKVATPGFDPEFVALAKILGGQWNGKSKAWFFGPITASLFAALVELYGRDRLSWCPEEGIGPQ